MTPPALRLPGLAAGLVAALALAACSEPQPAPSPAAGHELGQTEPVPADMPPGPDTTGVPDGVTLTPSGDLRIDEDGAVVENLDVTGCVVVAADDVTIRSTRITCTDAPRSRAVVMDGKRTGLVIEDSEIDGGGSVDIGVDTSNVTLRRVEIRNVNDGVRMGANITVEDSWIHDMTRSGELHPDAIQGISAQDVVIRGNLLDPRGPDGEDLGNAGIMLGSETGTMLSKNVLIEGNWFEGGNYAINVSERITAENIVIRGNRFGSGSRYGAILAPSFIEVADDNVDADGEPVGADRTDG